MYSCSKSYVGVIKEFKRQVFKIKTRCIHINQLNGIPLDKREYQINILIFTGKHILWVHIRSVSARSSNGVPITYVFVEK